MEHSKRMRACYSYKRKETFLSLNKIRIPEHGTRNPTRSYIHSVPLCLRPHFLSLSLSLSEQNNGRWIVPSRVSDAKRQRHDKIREKVPRRNPGWIFIGIALGSRDAIRWQSEIHAVYKPVMPETRRDVHSQRPYVYNLPLPVVH